MEFSPVAVERCRRLFLNWLNLVHGAHAVEK
jgi:hypothetical protein